jgi:glycine hydroxymethyltransferase
MILSNDIDLGKKFNSAVFPGLQGGPLMHVIAAKAVAFGEALDPSFKEYIKQVKKNAHVLSETLVDGGLKIVSGGTDTHLLLVDLTAKNVTGSEAEINLEEAGITCNKNGIPNDPNPPKITSGIRLGTPAGTTRGFKEDEFKLVGELILEVLNGMQGTEDEKNSINADVKSKVNTLCSKFPIYSS